MACPASFPPRGLLKRIFLGQRFSGNVQQRAQFVHVVERQGPPAIENVRDPPAALAQALHEVLTRNALVAHLYLDCLDGVGHPDTELLLLISVHPREEDLQFVVFFGSLFSLKYFINPLASCFVMLFGS